jgi:hypothetical protein
MSALLDHAFGERAHQLGVPRRRATAVRDVER